MCTECVYVPCMPDITKQMPGLGSRGWGGGGGESLCRLEVGTSMQQVQAVATGRRDRS